MKRPVITLLTDFGLTDHYVGAMKGAILCICPDAQIIDISHGVQPYQIAEGAYTLSQVWQHFPPGTVHVAVVDPGVGSSRRAILVEAGGQYFSAPDNGVLTAVFDSQPDWKARQITAREYLRDEVSQTFHGRDIFAPVAAHLAAGVSFEQFGPAISDPVILASMRPVQVAPGEWTGIVLKVDHFGNVITCFPWRDFRNIATESFELVLGRTAIRQYHANFSSSQSGQLFVVNGSSGFLEISLNQEDAARFLQIGPGDPMVLRTVL